MKGLLSPPLKKSFPFPSRASLVVSVLETVYSPAAIATPFEWCSSEGSSVDDGDQRCSRRSSEVLCSRGRGHRFEQHAVSLPQKDFQALFLFCPAPYETSHKRVKIESPAVTRRKWGFG
ncbi:hypothetical protein MRX96_044505 [Rhipicephalus microplus]